MQQKVGCMGAWWATEMPDKLSLSREVKIFKPSTSPVFGMGWSQIEGRKELSKINDKEQILGGQARLSSLFFGSCYGKEPITLSCLKPTAKRANRNFQKETIVSVLPHEFQVFFVCLFSVVRVDHFPKSLRKAKQLPSNLWHVASTTSTSGIRSCGRFIYEQCHKLVQEKFEDQGLHLISTLARVFST